MDKLTLTDRVHETLKRRIVQRELAPGAKLDLSELASALGVSRMPVVDALNRLEMEGLVERRDRVGSFVTGLSPEDFGNLFEARVMVETWALPRIVDNLTAADVQKLRGLLAESQALLRGVTEATFDYRRTLDLDQRFHMTLISRCGNQRIIDWYASLNAHIQIGRVYSLRALARCQGAQREHEGLLDALTAGDVPAALSAMHAHLDASRTGIMAILETHGDL